MAHFSHFRLTRSFWPVQNLSPDYEKLTRISYLDRDDHEYNRCIVPIKYLSMLYILLYSVKNVISLPYFLYVIIVLIYIDWYYFHIFESHFKKIQSSKTPHNYSRPFVDFRSGARFVNLPQMTIEWWSFTKEFAIFQKHNIDVTCVIMVRKLNKLLKVMHLGWFSNYLTVAS